MAKGPNDIILRDRLEFTLTGGSLGLVWGRINLDDYVNPLTNQGLDIKEIFIQPRTNGGSGEVATQLTNTGNFLGRDRIHSCDHRGFLECYESSCFYKGLPIYE